MNTTDPYELGELRNKLAFGCGDKTAVSRSISELNTLISLITITAS